MNICAFTGRTTADMELRYTGEQMAVSSFSLAVDDGYGEKQHTSFFSMTAFGKTAESLQKYVTKGTKIAVTARARQNTWTTKEGQKRSSVEFVVDGWEFAQSKGEGAQAAQAAKPPAAKKQKGGIPDDDFMRIPDDLDEELPFD